MLLKKNDRVVFLGDSITEQQLYTNYVETYLATRFPELKLTFFNAGWGGDTAPQALKRLQRDVLDLKPTLVTICYGMNDAGYVFPNAEIEARFKTAMKELLERVKASGARIVLLTNGFADVEAAAPFLKPVDYSRQGLKRLASVVLQLGKERGIPVFNLHALMTAVDTAARKKLKPFTLAPDGFHPNPAGHLVMAYGLLKVLQVPNRSLSVSIDLKKGTARGSKEIWVLDPKARPHGYAFNLLCRPLPFFVEAEARLVLPFVSFQADYNQCLVSFKGLKDPAYHFRLNGQDSRSYSRAELEKGVDVFSFWQGPLAAQAQGMLDFTREKCAVYYKLWRSLGMSGGYGDYRPGPHALAKSSVAPLDRLREKLALSVEPAHFELFSSAFKGEVVEEGGFVSLWKVKGPRNKAWRPVRLDTGNPTNSLGMHFGRLKNVTGEAETVVVSPKDQTVDFSVGSGDGFKMWVNGALAADRLKVSRLCQVDQDLVKVNLKKGRNEVRVVVAQHQPSWWGFCLRLKNLGSPVEAFHP